MTKKKTKAGGGVSHDELETALSSLTISSSVAENEDVSIQTLSSSLPDQILRGASYFDSFPDFTEDKSAPIRHEFDRLAKANGWGKKKDDYKEQRLICLTMEFDRYYKQLTTTNLEAWQILCAEIMPGSPVPPSITQCKKVSDPSVTTVWQRFLTDIHQASRKSLCQYLRLH